MRIAHGGLDFVTPFAAPSHTLICAFTHMASSRIFIYHFVSPPPPQPRPRVPSISRFRLRRPGAASFSRFHITIRRPDEGGRCRMPSFIALTRLNTHAPPVRDDLILSSPLIFPQMPLLHAGGTQHDRRTSRLMAQYGTPSAVADAITMPPLRVGDFVD